MKNYMKTLAVLSMAALLAGCQSADAENEIMEEVVVETQQETEATQQEAEATQQEAEATQQEGKIISPLPVTVDMNNLDHCTVAVSFEKGDAYIDDSGILQLDATIYTYDLYDMVDISLLEEGDTIVIREQEVVITSLEKRDSGMVVINGGIENDGYDLYTNESGVYYESGFNDVKSYYSLGEATIRVSTDFEFYDSYDLEKGEQVYYPGDFLTDDAGIVYDFNANNTNIVIEEGQIIKMTRMFTP